MTQILDCTTPTENGHTYHGQFSQTQPISEGIVFDHLSDLALLALFLSAQISLIKAHLQQLVDNWRSKHVFVEGMLSDQNTDLFIVATISVMQILSIEIVEQIPTCFSNC